MTSSFFKRAREQSRLKSVIVAKYFGAWSKVILSKSQAQIAYIDLYAGAGKFDDGPVSTPIMVLQHAVDNQNLSNRLITVFNDADLRFVKSLRKTISALPHIDNLFHEPIILNERIGDRIEAQLRGFEFTPTLMFVDPWGYKGLSIRLIMSVVQSWGSECIFFFNYNRINTAIGNPRVSHLIDAIFGNERADRLRVALRSCTTVQRERRIIAGMKEALKDEGAQYVVAFRFMNDRGTRTSHYVVHATKSRLGCNIMKDIMWKHSTEKTEGVASFEYRPTSEVAQAELWPMRPLDDLRRLLLHDFAARTISVREIHELHGGDHQFVLRNYKDCLMSMEEDQCITADPPADSRRKRRGRVTMADRVIITFPNRSCGE